ncbi:MAG: RNase J family beta-CASP ribonuclease, partial [Candidatus Hydrothermarchaeaceae archaeon]
MDFIGIGGYGEVGRNMTYLREGDDAIFLDSGIRLDRVLIHEDTDIRKMRYEELIAKGVIPDISIIDGGVKAIVLSHGHLDHIGAIALFYDRFKDIPIIGTPYTIEVLKRELGNRKARLHTVEMGETFRISPNMSVEFVRITHSIPQASLVVVHTPRGRYVYLNDFKLDDSPVIGQGPDYQRIRELGERGVNGLIIESIRIQVEGRTPSESIASRLLEDVMIKSHPDRGLIVTTFSSHIARIKSIAENANRIGRTPVLIGRSMEKYVGIAEDLGVIHLPEGAHIYGAPKSVTQILKKVAKEREEYVLVVTGHQGEEGAILTRMANDKTPYSIDGDEVIFSADVIPNPINAANRYALETKLKIKGARLFKGTHVSGHAAKEDHRDVLKTLNPEKVIPCHGDFAMLAAYADLASDSGYTINEDLFIV